jgi:hypothetical protein
MWWKFFAQELFALAVDEVLLGLLLRIGHAWSPPARTSDCPLWPVLEADRPGVSKESRTPMFDRAEA